MVAASENQFPKVVLEEVATDGSATATPAADHRALFLGEDGLLHVKDSAAAVTNPYATTPTFVGVKAYAAGTQSIADNTTTAVVLDTEEYDTDTFHDNATFNTRLTIPAGKGGKYMLVGGVSMVFTTSSVTAQMWWRIDGTTSVRAGVTWNPINNTAGWTITNVVTLTAGQYVELMVYQDSTGARNIGHASALESQSFASATLLGT